MKISEKEAKRRLANRWSEQVLIWPLMADEIPFRVYLRANLRKVMRDGLLGSYGEGFAVPTRGEL
jgi:hypothetical protein